jgi:thiosulfate reductase cytochrome b subunit
MATNGKLKNIYLYARFERLWHWLQTLLIIILLLTGLEVNGVFTLFGFATAVEVHNFVGLTWLIAFAFFVFWIFTTGEWRQYIPTTKKMFSVVRYYVYGIFRGEPHPVPKRKEAKHNPLQRIVYLILAALLLPVQMVTGFLYWGYNSWGEWGLSWLSLQVVALVHTAGAFAILVVSSLRFLGGLFRRVEILDFCGTIVLGSAIFGLSIGLAYTYISQRRRAKRPVERPLE